MAEFLVLLGFVLMMGSAGLYFLYRLLLGAPFEDPLPYRDRRRRPRLHPDDGKPVEKPK